MIDNQDGSITTPDGTPGDSWIQEHRSDEFEKGANAYTEDNLLPKYAGRKWFVSREEAYVYAWASERLSKAVAEETDPEEKRRLLSLPIAATDSQVSAAFMAIDAGALLKLQDVSVVRSTP